MLQKSKNGWVFTEEYLLEDFIWKHLESCLKLIPLKRQLNIDGEYCDILAKTRNNQLVALELKNCEDRYIIHQLTRYYHGLITRQPLREEVDYSLPIRLVAIAPEFHKHNFIDRQYSTLKFEFIRFQIIAENDKFYLGFLLEDHQELRIEESIVFSTKSTSNQSISLPPAPKFLLHHLDKIDDFTKRKALEVRDKILTKSPLITEEKLNNSLIYYSSKNKPCAQIRLVRGNEAYTPYIQLFLFLPLPPDFLRRNSKTNLGRVLLIIDREFSKIENLVHWRQTSRSPDKVILPLKNYLDWLGLKSYDIWSLLDLALDINLG
jgi:hypothetical protein